MNNNKWLSAIRSTIPVMAGYLVLGAGYGLLMQSKGYGLLWSLGASLFIYAGSMQFVAAELLTGGASLLTAALTTLLVNARHLFYGISMLPMYRNTGAAKPYLIFGLTDETYSLLCTREDGDTGYFLRVTALDHLYWVTGTVLGSLAGSVLTFNTEGVDFALTALFLTVVTEQWLTAKNHLPAIIGGAAAIVCRLLFGADSFLLPTMGAMAVLLLLARRQLEGKEAAHD